MQTIESKIEKIKKFQREVESHAINATKKHEAQMIDMNQMNMYAGFGSTGNAIKPDYTSRTMDLKESFRPPQPTDRVTLKDFGNFYDSIHIVYKDLSFLFYARDSKYNELRNKYEKDGNTLLGITDENLIDLRELIKPDLIEIFRRETL